MAESAGTYGDKRPHGTMAEEAAKLAEVAQLWLASRSGGTPRDDVWADATAEPSSGAPECEGCPICRVRRAFSGVNPEVYEHLSDAVTSLSAALRSLSKQSGHP